MSDTTTTVITRELQLEADILGLTDIIADMFVNAWSAGGEGDHAYYATLCTEALAICLNIREVDEADRMVSILTRLMEMNLCADIAAIKDALSGD